MANLDLSPKIFLISFIIVNNTVDKLPSMFNLLCRMIGFHDIGVWRKERPFNRKVTKNRSDWGNLTEKLTHH